MSVIKEQTRLRVPRARIEGVLDHLKVVRNPLFSAWLLPEQKDDASAWWESVESGQRGDYEELLQALAAPVLLATFTMLEGHTTALLRCLIPSTEPSTPVYLITEDEEHLSAVKLDHRDEAVDTLWELLRGNFPLWEMEWGATLPRESFYTLLAAADLHQRKELVGLLEHTVMGPEFLASEVQQMTERSFQYEDLRWLLPFFLTVNSRAPSQEEMSDCQGALKVLCETELLEGSEQGAYRWSPQGEFLAGQWAGRLSTAGLQILGVDHDGTPVSCQVGFLRGRKFLWYIDFSTDREQILLSTPSVSLCQELLDELLSPVGEPAGESKKADRGPVVAEVLFCPYCGGKLAVADARFCNSCGKALK
jgi:hypothetical protein